MTVRLIDGDGFHLASGENIRLWGIDAPELSQTCKRDSSSYFSGQSAKNMLQSFLLSAVPDCEVINKDRYGCSIARCKVGSDDLGVLMVRSGWALDYHRYSDGHYEAAENAARKANRGLWQGEFVAPWDYREARR